MQFLPAGAARDDESRVFEHTQMLHDTESRHLDVRLEFGERLTILGEQSVEYQAAGRIGQRLKT